MKTYFICNLTKNTYTAAKNSSWEIVGRLVVDGFAQPGDILEFLEMETKKFRYRTIEYKKEQVFTYGMERVNAEGNGVVPIKQRAADWLAEQVSPAGILLPTPKCGKCKNLFEKISDVQSIRDYGKCLKCIAENYCRIEKKKSKKSS